MLLDGQEAMQIIIQFMGQARVAAGCERAIIEVASHGNIRAALQAAVENCGEALRTFLFHADGQPRRSILLVVGQQQVSWDCTEPLHDGDCITILPPIAGG